MVSREEFGDKLIQDYLTLFDHVSFNNRMFGIMTLHVILGQALKHIYFKQRARKVDIRIHLLLIQPSGTGKGAGYSFFAKVCEDLGLDNQPLTESTDAGLAGSVAFYDHRTGEIVINEGLMKDADIISMEEASTLFDYATDFSKKNLTYLQIAMNPLHDASCQITKKIGSLPNAINFKPHCSFLLLTYLPDKFVDALVKRGVIQRFITVIRDISLEDRLKTVNTAIDSLVKPTNINYDELYKSVIKRLKIIIERYQKLANIEVTRYDCKEDSIRRTLKNNIKPKLTTEQLDYIMKRINDCLRKFENDKWYLEYGYCFNVSDKAKEALRQVEHELIMMIKDTTKTAQEKLAEFTHRLYENLVKLSIHHAILRLDTTVQVEDVIYAKKVYQPIWRNLIYFIEEHLTPSSFERLKMHSIITRAVEEYKKQLKLKKYVYDGVWVRRATLIKELQRAWDNCSYVTASKRLASIETTDPKTDDKNKWFLVKRIGNIPYVRLLQDIKL